MPQNKRFCFHNETFQGPKKVFLGRAKLLL